MSVFLFWGGYLYNLNHGSPSIVLLLCKVISRTLISLNLTYSIVDKWKQNTEVESLKLHGKCNLGIVLWAVTTHLCGDLFSTPCYFIWCCRPCHHLWFCKVHTDRLLNFTLHYFCRTTLDSIFCNFEKKANQLL